jgi:hypothetical protein
MIYTSTFGTAVFCMCLRIPVFFFSLDYIELYIYQLLCANISMVKCIFDHCMLMCLLLPNSMEMLYLVVNPFI